MMNNRYRSRPFLSRLNPQSRGMFVSVVFLGGIIFTILFAYAAFGDNVQTGSPTLKQVIILHRHGDRTPTHSYENDPYKDEKKYWPLGWGQLTLVGKQQLYKLGKTLQKLYKAFVPTFHVKTVRVESSDVDRALMSVNALLAAMFPPQENQIWVKDLLWQPIPVHTRPKQNDNMLAIKAPCPKYKEEWEKVLQEFKTNETEVDKEFYQYVTLNAGQSIKTIREVETIYSCLFIEELNGLPLPEWTKEVYPDKMKAKAALSMASHTWNTVTKRLHGGPFLNQIFGHFKNRTESHFKNDVKMYLYSAHDITLVSVWRTLGFKEFILPHYGAAYIWELHEVGDEYYVKMLSLNSTDLEEPYELHIPNCLQPCPLNMLFKITEDVRPVDWNLECQTIS